MIRIRYAPGAYDLFHIGHLNLLRRAREHCEYLIAGVVADEVLTRDKGVTPVIPLAERVEIVRNVRFVDAAVPALTNDKVDIWKDLRFNVLFKGNGWQGTEKGNKLERHFAALGVEVVYFPYTLSMSSSELRRTLQNIDALAGHTSSDSNLEARGLSGSPTPTKEDTCHVSVGSGRACPKPPFMGHPEQDSRD
jgi:glycerol-3-phosphate cytidylyltransferase